MLLNSSGTAKGGVAWLAAGIIVVFLVVLWLFSGRGPWAPEAPAKNLAKTVIQKKVTHIPKSLEQEAVQKAAAIIPLKPPAPAETPQPPAPEIAAKVPDPTEAEQPVEEKPAAEEPIIAAEQPVESQAATEEPPAAKAPPVVKKQPLMAATAPETTPKPKIETPPAPVKKPVPQKPVVAMIKPAASEIHREKWLLSQDASSYTIQIIGVSSEKSLLKFIEKNQLSKQNDIAYYKSVLRGKPWFQALYGIYPTKEEARRAIKKLPENIRLAGPWIRKLAGVQNTIVN